MEKEKAEMDRKRQLEKEAEEREEEEDEEESRSPSVSRRQSMPPLSTPIEETRTVRMVTSPRRTVKMIPTPPPTAAGDGDDDDLDDLEMLMRDFKEAESKEKVSTPSRPSPAPKVDSLALLRDSYGAKRARSRSPSPKESKSVTIPSGFDADGHPLPGAGGDLPLLARATTSTALAIMGPAKKEKGRSGQLECSLCMEEALSKGTTYISAYQLLSHVFLAHRKKIVSRSRKARGMTLACPEGCGFVTRQSAQVSF